MYFCTHMEQYIVSARKYRPDSFSSLIGQDNIARTLRNSILRGQLAHAYLFCGPRGVGKTSTARIFAKMINCSNPSPELEPCGQCDSCVSFEQGRSFCIHELDAASNNGVEDIKALMDKVRVPPRVGKYSVFIIDEVHMLSQAAFNAFLKTLEEPPAHAIFILATTEKHKILPTILSRCQTYDFNRITVPDIVSNLKAIAAKEGVSVEDEALHVIAQKADGAMRDALTLFDQAVAFCGKEISYGEVISNLNVLSYEYYFTLVRCFMESDYASALRLFDEVLSKGFNALHFISGLSTHFRDLIVCAAGSLDALLDFPQSLKERYRQQALTLDVAFMYKALEICVQCEAGYRAAVNQRLHIEFALMKLSFLSGVSISEPKEMPAPLAQDVPKDGRSEALATSMSEARAMEQPQPQQPPRKRRTAVSISSIMESGIGQQSSEVAAEAPHGEEPVPLHKAELSVDAAKEVFAAVAQEYVSKPRLFSAISNPHLEISSQQDKVSVVFYVLNDSQKIWIQEKLHRNLEGRLRSALGRNDLYLEIMVEPDNEDKPQRLYLPTEKAKFMMENSSEVRNLCNDLGLDIK